LRRGEDEEREHQLGGIAQADVQQTADFDAGALRQLIGGASQPIGKYGDRGGASQEDPAGWRIDEVAQHQRKRHEQQQGVGLTATDIATRKPEAIWRGVGPEFLGPPSNA
jgi:hypothetical protein